MKSLKRCRGAKANVRLETYLYHHAEIRATVESFWRHNCHPALLARNRESAVLVSPFARSLIRAKTSIVSLAVSYTRKSSLLCIGRRQEHACPCYYFKVVRAFSLNDCRCYTRGCAVGVLRWIGRILIGLAVLVILAVGTVYLISQRMFTQRIAVAAQAPAVSLHLGNIRRGEHLVRAVAACTDCHGADLGGRLVVDSPLLGKLYAPNLTSGSGGAGARFTDADWVQAVRYGVRPDGTPLLIMPSRDYSELTHPDFAAIVSYILRAPPVNNTTPPAVPGPLARALFATHQLPLAAYEIEHDKPEPSNLKPGVTVAYGRYLARVAGCISCHGPHLSGGHFEGAPSDPPAQNLTPAGDLGHWSFAQFKQTIRTGARPDGTHLDTFMPWPTISQMSDDELLAIYSFLKSVPPRPTGK